MSYRRIFFSLIISLIFLSQCITEPDSTVSNIPDSTSHDFTWNIDTLGIYGSTIRDVAIVDENDIWVVGEITVKDPDSSWNGTGREKYNAAHWNGNKWDMHRFKTPNYYRNLYDIWYFSGRNIWLVSGNSINKYNGDSTRKL